MKLPKKLENFLNKNKIKYKIIKHKTVYTAYDKAKTLKVSPNRVAKTLILKTDKSLVMVLISGNKNLDKNKFKRLVNSFKKKKREKLVKSINFISEKVIKNKFKGVKIGVIPPFGDFWKLPTYLDRALLKVPKIIVSAGSYDCSLVITPRELRKTNQDLKIGSFGKKRK